MAENAGKVNALWALALNAAEHDLDRALDHLVEIEITLETMMRLERTDLLAIVREGIKRVDAELPDEEDD